MDLMLLFFFLVVLGSVYLWDAIPKGVRKLMQYMKKSHALTIDPENKLRFCYWKMCECDGTKHWHRVFENTRDGTTYEDPQCYDEETKNMIGKAGSFST